jgi:hypothetical protein
MSIRPKTTYNSLPNRQYFEVTDIQLIATGVNPVYWELVAGATTAASTWADCNAAYSGLEYTSVRGSFTNLTNGVVLASGYISGAGSGGAGQPIVTPVVIPQNLSKKWPISLNRAGAVRDMGTYTLLISGIGGVSACRAVINYKEVR